MNNINTLNRKLVSLIDDKYPINFAYGKMGVCFYFYYLSRWENNEEYKQIAEKLLDEVIDNLSTTKDISLEYGLAGIAAGISHLVKQKFVGGDINEILEEIDSHIFKLLAFLEKEKPNYPIPILFQLLYYLYLRYTEQISSDGKYIFQELIIKVIEIFQQNLHVDFFNEHFSFSIQNYQTPLFLYIFSKIYELNIYNHRIIKISEEAIDKIVSRIPVLHANRLYLLWGLLTIKPYLTNYKNEIDSHIRLLKENIDIDHIVNVELKNQDIYVKDGISLVYILLYSIQAKYPEYRVEYIPQLFFNRIKNSETWNSLINREYYQYKHNGLFDGFPGVYLVLLHIQKHLS